MKHKWNYKSIGEVCSVVGGSTPKTNIEEFWGGELNWFTPAEIDERKYYDESERKITHEAVRSSGLTLLPVGTVLLTSRAPIGKIGIITKESYCNQGFKNLICNEGLYNEYLYYVLLFFNEDIKGKGRGSTFKEISKKITEAIEIPVPPIDVQEQIVVELDKINEIINDCKEAINNLDTFTQSLFYDFFGDPLTNPKHWEVCKLGDKFETGSGGTPSKTVNEYWENGDIPWIGSNMCQNKIITETDGKFITSLGLENSSAKVLEPNTVLVALVGATIGKVGLLKIHSATNQNIGFIKPNPTIAFPLYLFFVIKNLHSLFTNIGNGKFKMANLSFIRNLPIMLPPLSLQNKFASRIEQIEQQKNLEETIANMQMLLNSRMDYWFN